MSEKARINTALPHSRFDTHFYGKTVEERMILNGPAPWADEVPGDIEAWFTLLDSNLYFGDRARIVLKNISSTFGVKPEDLFSRYQELPEPKVCPACGEMFWPGEHSREEWIRHRFVCMME